MTPKPAPLPLESMFSKTLFRIVKSCDGAATWPQITGPVSGYLRASPTFLTTLLVTVTLATVVFGQLPLADPWGQGRCPGHPGRR